MLLAMTALLAFAMALLMVLANLGRVRERWAYAAKAFAIALMVTATIIVWPLSVQLAGLWYRMPGGYFIGPHKDSDHPRFDAVPSPGSITFARIFGGVTPPRLSGPMRRALARDLVRWRVGSVVVGPMPNQAAMLGFLTELFGSRPQRVEGVYLWREPVPVLTDPRRRPPT